MVLRRRLVERKRQVTVAVPAEVRELLSVGPGEGVYWHLTHRGAVMLSRSAGTSAGRPVDPALTRQVRELQRRVKRLRARLAHQPETAYNAGFSQGFNRGVAEGPRWVDAVQRVMRELEDIRDRVDETLALVRKSRPAAERVAAAGVRPDAHPSPPAPPPSVEIDGGDAASGAEPPGRPL